MGQLQVKYPVRIIYRLHEVQIDKRTPGKGDGLSINIEGLGETIWCTPSSTATNFNLIYSVEHAIALAQQRIDQWFESNGLESVPPTDTTPVTPDSNQSAILAD